MAIEEKKFLGTAGVQQLITNTRSEISAAEKAAKDYADSLADNYDAAGVAETKVQELANGQVKTNTEHIGTMENLETAAKSDLVNAINEVRNAVSAGGTAAAITMEEKTSDLGEGVLKAYVLKQGTSTVGTINIPKDMVVQSGEVVTNPEGQAAGTYIKLTLANATNDVIYVNVGTLVDIYKAKANAAQIQLAIDSSTREISATIVAGSVTATELAADAVTTVKIADGNVTKAKLSSEVQASLDKADGAAADATGKANQALADAKDYADGLNATMNGRVEALEAIDHDHSNKAELDKIAEGDVAKWNGAQAAAEKTAKEYADGLNTAMNGRVEALEAIDHDHSNKAVLDSYDKTQTELLAAADSAAKSYADGLNTAMNTRVEALENVSYVEITAAEIDAMFEA